MPKPGSLFANPTLLVWGGLLAAFFVANGVFIYLAQKSNPGLVVDNYYERGQDYEKNMLKRMANAPGWELSLERPPVLAVARPAVFQLSIASGSGSVLNPDSVTVRAYRPTDAQYDFAVPMRALDSGVFRADVTFPLPGIWDLLVVVQQGDQEQSVAERIRVAD